MVFLVKAFYIPIPIVAAAAYVVQEPTMDITSPQGPEWLIGAVAGIWVVIWFLDKAGRLPYTQNQDRREGPKFEQQDRNNLVDLRQRIQQISEVVHSEAAKNRQLHGLLTYRSDDDGIERWLRHHQVTVESRALIHKVVEMTEEIRSLRVDEHRKTGVLISTLEAQQKALVNIQRQLDELNKRAG